MNPIPTQIDTIPTPNPIPLHMIPNPESNPHSDSSFDSDSGFGIAPGLNSFCSFVFLITKNGLIRVFTMSYATREYKKAKLHTVDFCFPPFIFITFSFPIQVFNVHSTLCNIIGNFCHSLQTCPDSNHRFGVDRAVLIVTFCYR